MIKTLARFLFSVSTWFFKTTTVYFPSRVFDMIGNRAFPTAEYLWYTNTYQASLLLSPHFHIDRNIILFGCYDHQLHEIIMQRCGKGMVCLDIGANLGEVTLHLAMIVGPEGKVLSFDPNPIAFRRLKEHVSANHLDAVVTCLPIALSNATGELQLSMPDESESNQGLGSVVNNQLPGVSHTVSVKTVTLDDIVEEYGLTRIDLIKIDTQGAEPLILDGATKVLNRFSPDILMEISPSDLRHLGMTSRDLLKKIEEFGYLIFEFSDGVITRRVITDKVPEDYAVENVICTKRSGK